MVNAEGEALEVLPLHHLRNNDAGRRSLMLSVCAPKRGKEITTMRKVIKVVQAMGHLLKTFIEVPPINR